MSSPQAPARRSGVELLRVLAMLGIVVFHSLMSLGGRGQPAAPWMVDVFALEPGLTRSALLLLRTLGSVGNVTFMVCASWFLCADDRVSGPKALRMLLEAWVLSVLALLAFSLAGVDLSWKTVVKCLAPTLFENNWFVTCYLVVYAAHPVFNLVVRKLGGGGVLRATAAVSFAWLVLPALHRGMLYSTSLTTFVAVYFVTACARSCFPAFCADARANRQVLLASASLLAALVLGTDWLGGRVPFLSGRALHWACNENPVVVAIALSSFNLANASRLRSARVNRIASLLLPVYIIHENLLVRTYLGTAAWAWIHSTVGYGSLLGLVAVYAAVLFLASLALAAVFRATLGKAVIAVSERVAPRIVFLLDVTFARLVRHG